MVSTRTGAEEADPGQLRDNRRSRQSFYLQQAREISCVLEEHDQTTSWSLKLSEDEPWERSLSKLLGDSSSSLYSFQSQTTKDTTGTFRLEHTESRDRCSKTEEDDEKFVHTLFPTRPYTQNIYRSTTARETSLLDSDHDESVSDTMDSPTLRATFVRSADDGVYERRQDHAGYREIMSRHGLICLARQQHRELFSPAHSFDDVRHFSDDINLPYLPSLDDSPGMDDSNTVRRLPPRFDTTAALTGDTSMIDYPKH